MSQLTLRVNLNAANIPFVSSFSGRTIIVPQGDTNYQPKMVAGEDEPDRGIPQVFYCHNIIPVNGGIQSVGYVKKSNTVSGNISFDQAFTVSDSDNNIAIYSPAQGKNYLLTGVGIPDWVNMEDIGNTGGKLITKAQINNRTLIFVEGEGCYEINIEEGTISEVTLTGLTPEDIIGISAANNYLLAFSKDTFFWSSPNAGSETDFTPSLITGAGSGVPQDLAGKIVTVVNIAGGAVIYTTQNMISVAYSGNARFPWVFRLIPNSAGIQSANHVTRESYAATHYAWTSSGLMQVAPTAATNVFPDASDFLSSGLFEDYDSVTDELVQQRLSGELSIQLSYISSRFFIISYGIVPATYTHALFYDISLKRWGKLKITHSDCFEYRVPNYFGIQTYARLSPRSYADLAGNTYAQLSEGQNTATPARDTVAFLQANGQIFVMNVNVDALASDSVVYLGKYQLIRASVFTLYGFEVENVATTANNFEATVLTSFNGKNFDLVTPGFLQKTEPNYRKYLSRVTGTNHTIRITGTFNLISMLITGQRAGYR